MRNKILVIDDEPSVMTLLQYNLEQAGFEVIAAMDGEEGKRLAETQSPDLILLDLMLPKLDGMEVCKQLRQKKIITPIVILTAKDQELDKILALELGADDYMVKPFSPREVIARIRAINRRTNFQTATANDIKIEETKIVIGEITIYPKEFEAYFKGNPIELTLKEFELLVYLAKNKGRVQSREALLNAVWKHDFSSDSRILDVHISHLREKMKEETKRPVYIKTFRGVGYKLEEPKM